jgi:hypothetical protein
LEFQSAIAPKSVTSNLNKIARLLQELFEQIAEIVRETHSTNDTRPFSKIVFSQHPVDELPISGKFYENFSSIPFGFRSVPIPKRPVLTPDRPIYRFQNVVPIIRKLFDDVPKDAV